MAYTGQQKVTLKWPTQNKKRNFKGIWVIMFLLSLSA